MSYIITFGLNSKSMLHIIKQINICRCKTDGRCSECEQGQKTLVFLTRLLQNAVQRTFLVTHRENSSHSRLTRASGSPVGQCWQWGRNTQRSSQWKERGTEEEGKGRSWPETRSTILTLTRYYPISIPHINWQTLCPQPPIWRLEVTFLFWADNSSNHKINIWAHWHFVVHVFAAEAFLSSG